MKRILVTGAGGAPALNFIKSLRMAPEPFHLIGVDCDVYTLARAQIDERHLGLRASEERYITVLNDIITATGAELLFAQPDLEISVISENRQDIDAATYLPAAQTVEMCQDKYRTYEAWRNAGLTVPETLLVASPDDLRSAFEASPHVWLRPVIGAAGRGALHTESLDEARMWLDFNNGWGRYTAAAYLSPGSVTWQSLWRHGELIVAQGRKRLYWEFADRAPSGVTGITGAAVTVSDPVVDEIALRAITAVDGSPHGVFSVDLTYDDEGVPNPTEINIGRFFTTHLFFSSAGLNMPYMLVKLAYGEEPPPVARKVNPLPAGLLWIRGMDMEPVLTDLETVEGYRRELAGRLNGRGLAEGLKRG